VPCYLSVNKVVHIIFKRTLNYRIQRRIILYQYITNMVFEDEYIGQVGLRFQQEVTTEAEGMQCYRIIVETSSPVLSQTCPPTAECMRQHSIIAVAAAAAAPQPSRSLLVIGATNQRSVSAPTTSLWTRPWRHPHQLCLLIRPISSLSSKSLAWPKRTAVCGMLASGAN